MENPIGKTVRGYEFRTQLGRGGCGIVYRAYQATLDREVAVKFLLPELAGNSDFVESFDSEAKLVARLEHPHIVPIYDYWHDSTSAAIVMRCLRGGSLREHLHAQGKLSLEYTARLLDQIGSALATAHKSGIVHRDLKPENILFDENGAAYLTDFGIALPSGGQSPDNIFTGTLAYAAPEQLQGFPPNPEMDVYSFGIILYELLTGKHPVHGLAMHEIVYWHFNEPVPQVLDLPKETLDQINEIIQRATAKDPDKRYRDAFEIAVDFRQAMALDVQEADTQRAKISKIEPERKLIVQQHLDYLYQRLDGLYEDLQTDHGDDTDAAIKARIQQLQLEVDYRNNGLKVLGQNVRFNPPLVLCPPAAPQHPLVGISPRQQQLKQRLLSGKSYTLLGPAGIGKSELAATMARDEDVQAHYNGRVLWMPFGKTPDFFTLLGEWLSALEVSAEDLSRLTRLDERKKRLQALLGAQSQPVLMICDDVWRAEQVKSTLMDSRNRLVYLVTTLSADVATELPWEFERLDALSVEHRIELVGGIVPGVLESPDAIRALVERIGGFPRDLMLLAMRLRKAGGSPSRLQREIEKVKPADIHAQGYESLALTVDELTDGARAALWALAVLPAEPNSFSEAAGEAICEDIAYLDELTDYSLLKIEQGVGGGSSTAADSAGDRAGDRYAIHPSFAEYAREFIPEDTAVYARIVDYYLSFAAAHGGDFPLLALEQRNIERALTLALEHGITAKIPAAAVAFVPYLQSRGMLEGVERFLDSALQVDSVAPRQRAEVYLAYAKFNEIRGDIEQSAAQVALAQDALGSTAHQHADLLLEITLQKAQINSLQGDFDQAKALYGQALESKALETTQGRGNLIAVCEIYSSLGAIEVYDQNNPANARVYFLKALEAARGANDPFSICNVLSNLGLLNTQYFREFTLAKSYLVEALEIARRLGHAQQISKVLQARGSLELYQNHTQQAALYFEEALQKARLSGSVEALAFALLTLGNVVVSLDQFNKSEEYLVESLKYAQMMESPVVIGFIVDVLIKTGETRIAHQQLGYDETIWETIIASAKTAEIDPDKLLWVEDTRRRIRQVGRENVFLAQSRAQFKLGQLEGDGFHDYEQAKRHFKESLKLATEIEDTVMMITALNELCHAYVQLDEFSSAEAVMRASVELSHSQPQLRDITLQRVQALGEARIAAKAFEVDELLWKSTLELAAKSPTPVTPDPTEIETSETPELSTLATSENDQVDTSAAEPVAAPITTEATQDISISTTTERLRDILARLRSGEAMRDHQAAGSEPAGSHT